jgi:mono/diheme cytochrome c family protein
MCNPLRFLNSQVMPLVWMLILGAMSSSAWASSAAEQQKQWTVIARQSELAYAPSVARGKSLYEHHFNRNTEMSSCAACHTGSPTGQGKHAITSKTIAPLSPLANAERFTDAAKTEKWFRRNCNDVIGRECTSAEKADLVEFFLKSAK